MSKIKNSQLKWQATTPLNRQFDDPYFSLANGPAETEYVFLKHNGLPEHWLGKPHFVIAETGFGTGLNFLVTAHHWVNSSADDTHLYYFSVEKYPLRKCDLRRSFENWPEFQSISSRLIEKYPDTLPGFHTIEFVEEGISLVLMIGDVGAMLTNLQASVDCWYLDGFSPAKNPEMWSLDVCEKIAQLSHVNTRFSTFTAAGSVRRNLQFVGFEVKKSPGFGKKREMLWGSFAGIGSSIHSHSDSTPNPNANKEKSKYTQKPWFNIDQLALTSRDDEVVIIGGGLAALSCAWMLAKANVHSTVLEVGKNLASGASGNSAGIVMPWFSVDMNLASQFYLSAFLFAISCLDELKAKCQSLVWRQHGVVQLASPQRLQSMAKLGMPVDLLQCLEKNEASTLTGIELTQGALYYPLAGHVNPHQLCHVLAKQSERFLKIETQTGVHQLTRMKDTWQLYDEHHQLIMETQKIILANGFDAARLLGSDNLGISKSRGQLSEIPVQHALKNLKQVVCYESYVIPETDGKHIIGATYGPGNATDSLLAADHLKNLAGVEKMLPNKLAVKQADFSGRVSYRTSSVDHLPLVGPVPDEAAYMNDYRNIHHGRQQADYPKAKYLPGLYLSTGHGSRGLVSCFSSAAYLASILSGKPVTLGKNISQLLHPGRSLIGAIKKNKRTCQ